MPAEVGTGAGHVPRQARYLIPRGLPRRAEFLAACAVVLVLAHLVFAQLTLVCAAACYLIGRATRWRVSWLFCPVLAAAAWTLAVGPRVAIAGYAAAAVSVIKYFKASGHVLHPAGAFGGAAAWLPRQFPVALAAGAAEAGVAAWLSWLHTDEWNLPRSRPGLLAGVRRIAIRRSIQYGAILTRDGACLGVAEGTGGRVELTWAEAERGVLVCGSDPAEPLDTSLQLVSAALRRRKPVLVVDFTPGPDLRRALAACCVAAGVPLRVFGGSSAGSGAHGTGSGARGTTLAGAQPGWYEPFRSGDPARRAAMVIAMLTWEPAAEHQRRGLAAYLTDVFELLDAAPGDPRVPVLDEVIHLLDPGALRARAGHVPGRYPRRAALTERIEASAGVAAADPAAAAEAGRQLRALRAAPAGRWLGQPVGANAADLDLAKVVAGRSVALFCLDGADQPAHAMLGRLVLADLLRLAGDLPGLGVPADGLVWLAAPPSGQASLGQVPSGQAPLGQVPSGQARGQEMPEQQVTELIGAAPSAGLAVMVTGAARAADGPFAESVNALVIHRITDHGAARRLAALAGPRVPLPGSDGVELPGEVAAADVLSLTDSEFLLAVREPRRLIQRARAIRADRRR